MRDMSPAQRPVLQLCLRLDGPRAMPVDMQPVRGLSRAVAAAAALALAARALASAAYPTAAGAIEPTS